MFSRWRKRKSGQISFRNELIADKEMEIVIPSHFKCPISLDMMKDPVTLSSGITYDRCSIEQWLEDGNFTCPVTNQILQSFDQIPNHTIRKMTQDWCVENQRYGISRIPTPRVPVSTTEISDILVNISALSRLLDQSRCLELVMKMKKWVMESERNKQNVIDNWSIGTLSEAFDRFASHSFESNSDVLREILSLLSMMFPLNSEAQKCMGSKASLRCIIKFLSVDDLTSSMENSILVLKELLSSDQKLVETLSEFEEVDRILVDMATQHTCPTKTKSSLDVIFHMVSFSSPEYSIKPGFLETGFVQKLLEMIAERERGVGERALGVLDAICSSEIGRERVHGNALSIPILVKKVLRVSAMATEHSVSAIWKLCKNGGEAAIVEALQCGAFQKLLLVLQIHCGDETREKASELLKLLNPRRSSGFECIDSIAFNNLKLCT